VLSSEAGAVQWELAGVTTDVKIVKRMIVLGVALDVEGSTWCSVQHRISLAWQHFMARKSQFTNKRVALRKRIDRLRQTVLRTLLHGAGGWHIDTKCTRAIAACEAGMLRMMLCRRPSEGQSQGDFIHALNSKLRALREEWNMSKWSDEAARLTLGWWGHVSRHPSMLKDLLCWRDREWVARNRRVRYSRPGPQLHPDDAVRALLGPSWQLAAAERGIWHLATSYVLRDIFGITCPAFWHNSNRMADWLLGGRVLRRIAVVQYTDSQVVAAQATGTWVAHCMYTQFLRWSHHCLGCFFENQGLRWFEREQNAPADLLAGTAHTYGTSELDVIPCDVSDVTGVILTSDGSARDGVATCAACVWVHGPGGTALAAYQRVWLGAMDSLQAEFEGAGLALHIFIRWAWAVGVVGASRGWT
jgi:hypothetical protein